MRVFGIGTGELVGGSVAVLIGLAALIEASSYPLGELRNLGPGFFPIVFGALMVLFGFGIILVEGRSPDVLAPPRPAVRALLAILSAVLAFALLIEKAGLGPAVVAAVFLSTLAETRFQPVRSLIFGVVMALASILIFKVGLGLQVEAVAW